jgi:hypothetical protein
VTHATGALVPDRLRDRRARIAALLRTPEHRRLWVTSPYFRLSVSQLVDHTIPALIRGARQSRGETAVQIMVDSAAEALVDGFAEEADERDQQAATIARAFDVPLHLVQGPHRSRVPASEPIHHKIGDRTVTRHPSDC